MGVYFLNQEHFNAYEECVNRGQISEKATTFRSVLYLLTATNSIREYLDELVSVLGQYITPDGLEGLNISCGERTLVLVAYNLYNGYSIPEYDLSPNRLFENLGDEYKQIVLNAIELKFGLIQEEKEEAIA